MLKYCNKPLCLLRKIDPKPKIENNQLQDSITIKKVGLFSSKMNNRMMYRMMAIIKDTFLIFSTECQKRFPIEIKMKPVKKVIIPNKYPWDVPA